MLESAPTRQPKRPPSKDGLEAGDIRNRLLAALPPRAYSALADKLEPVTLELRSILYDYDAPIEYIYFPETMVASVVGVMADGSAIEAATIGNEGVVGITVFLGGDRIAAQAFTQVTGEALRMTAADFRKFGYTPAGREILGRYTQALFTQVSQSAACNRTHSMVQRLARWLLQTHDRVGGRDHFPLTLEFMAQMLGVRTATVTEAASTLQHLGAMTYANGNIAVTDRLALDAASCECYTIIAREYARLIEGRDSPSPLRDVPKSADGQSILRAPREAAD
jgi:CRP-like cAMP-binding protein